jgi:phosphoserine phosphatase RsbU/P
MARGEESTHGGFDSVPGNKVQFLLETIAEVNSTRDLEDVLTGIVTNTLALTGAERAILMLMEGGELRLRLARNSKGKTLDEDVTHSRWVPDEVARTGEPKILKNVPAEELADLSTSIINLRLLSLLCVPLRYKDEIIGVIYADSRATTQSFDESDLAIFQAMADQAAIAIENARLLEASLEKERIQHELRIAQSIQTGLLPAGHLPLEGFDIFGLSEPCDETGGDYFDYIEGRDGLEWIAIGDVTGHGVSAALLMTTARAGLRACAVAEPDMGACVAQLNDHLERDMDPGQFMTLFLAELDPANRCFQYLCAGHNPPLIVRASGEFEELQRTGLGLGIMAGSRYGVAGSVDLAPGDILFLYTDGITEARRIRGEEKEMFGMERLQGVLLESREKSAQDITKNVREAVAAWRGVTPRDDDETMVVVKAL